MPNWPKVRDRANRRLMPHFREAVTFMPREGLSFDGFGAFVEDGAEVRIADGFPVVGSELELHVLASDFTDPLVKGDRLQVRGKTFRIEEVQTPNEGLIPLRLEVI